MPLKTDPKYGYFPWWPENGDAWVHPEDVELARQMIPSDRVFRRDGQRGDFVVMHYGDQKLRVRPALWQELPPPTFDIGDWVEVLSRGMKNTPRLAVVHEILWNDEAREIQYRVAESGQPIANLYAPDDLRHIEPTTPKSD